MKLSINFPSIEDILASDNAGYPIPESTYFILITPHEATEELTIVPPTTFEIWDSLDAEDSDPDPIKENLTYSELCDFLFPYLKDEAMSKQNPLTFKPRQR